MSYEYRYWHENSWPWSYQNQQIPYPGYKEEKPMPTEKKKFIIISSAGAAEKPVEHKTLAEAEKEAERLARQFPKQEFTIFETKKSYKVADKPVDVKVFV